MQVTVDTPHLGPLEARQTVALPGDVVTHRAVVAVAPPLAVHVVGAGGAGVGADLALDNTRCAPHTVTHNTTHRPAHGAVADPGDGVAVPLVLTQTRAGAVCPVCPRGAGVVTQGASPARGAAARPGLGITDSACKYCVINCVI